MPLILFKTESEVRAIVTMVHYMPRDKENGLPEDIIVQGVEVDNILEPNNAPYKNAVHYINPQTLEQWYEYIDRPLTTEEEITKLKQENATMQDTINFLLGL